MTAAHQVTLTSHDRWLDVADYDVESHVIGDVRHFDDADELKRLTVTGKFGTTGPQRLIVRLDRRDARLLVGFERQPEFGFDDAELEWTVLDDANARFTLSANGYQYTVDYPHNRAMIDDPYNFSTTSYDDFDYGLWVFELQNDPGRRERIVGNWRGSEQ